MPEKISLSVIMGHCPCQHTIGAWRAPRAFRGLTYSEPEFWEHVGRTLERARVELLLLADQYGVYDVYEGSADAAVRHAVQFPLHDPTPLVPVVARVTRHLGVAVTVSTTYLPPYHIARLLSTLDHLSAGRAAWNIVTSYGRNAAANFGLPAEMPKSERYARADECVTACKQLWSSWEPGAIVNDREGSVYVRPEGVRKIHFMGDYVSVEGPLSVPPMPHGHPVLIQAGASGSGLRFAARHAEVHFATGASVAAMREHMCRLTQAVAEETPGRRPPKVFWGASVSVGSTRSEAVEKDERLGALVPLEGSLAQMSGDLGVDLSAFPLDTPFSAVALEDGSGIQGVAQMLRREYGDLTLRAVAELFGIGMGGLRFVGSAEDVAEEMSHVLDAGGGDGFILRCGVLPESLSDIAELLVPALQRMGRYRTAYESPCLRDRIRR